MAHGDEPEDERPPTGMIALSIGAMALCCLGAPILLGIGGAGLAALVFDNLWWLGLGVALLAPVIVGGRMRRRNAFGRASPDE
ncbi:MAG: hypothetical protein ACFCVH_03895 [Alphaproteobacteria bacterium]